jgi:DNA-directed RNA polymerase subunit RPC12/RpoP
MKNYNYSENKYCKCGKLICNSATYCNRCERIIRYAKIKSPNYIDGRSTKKYYCTNCQKEINCNTAIYGNHRCRSCAMKVLFKNSQNHPNYIDGRTDKKYYCVDCRKEISGYEAKRCSNCFQKGELNHNFNNWSSKEPYNIEWTKQLKESIRQRDNYICQNCGMTEKEHLIVYDRILTIHHIDYDKQNCKEDNLLSLCSQCNSRVNFNRDYWYAYFRYIIDKITKKGE